MAQFQKAPLSANQHDHQNLRQAPSPLPANIGERRHAFRHFCSSSKTVLVIRDTASQRAFLNPAPIRSCRVNGIIISARAANGEPGSLAHPHMSAKKVLTALPRRVRSVYCLYAGSVS